MVMLFFCTKRERPPQIFNREYTNTRAFRSKRGARSVFYLYQTDGFFIAKRSKNGISTFFTRPRDDHEFL